MSIFGNWAGQRDNQPAPAPNANDPATKNLSGVTVGQSKDNNKDNNKDNVDPYDAIVEDIWKDVKKEGTQGGDPPPNNGNQPPPNNNNQVDPQKQVSDYLKGVGLTDIAMSESEREAFKNGDEGAINKFLGDINSRIATAHIQSIKGAQTLIDNAVKVAVEKAVGQSKQYIEGKELRVYLNEKLPFTADPVIGPVAETIMQRALAKGATTDEATKTVDRFFARSTQKYDPNYTPNSNQNGRFSSPRSPQGAKDTDWLDALKGEAG